MKRILPLLCIITMFATFAAAQSNRSQAGVELSRAEQSIAQLAKRSARSRPNIPGYNLLATALVRRAQETSDASFYAQADRRGKEIAGTDAPNNFDTEKIQVSILLGEHEYPAALEAAKALNKQVPDDVMVYGLLTDANVELGNYKDAEDCGSVDAQSSSRQSACADPGSASARIIRGCGRCLRIDGHGLSVDTCRPKSKNGLRSSRRWAICAWLPATPMRRRSSTSRHWQVFQSIPPPWEIWLRFASRRSATADAATLLEQRYQAHPAPENLYDLARGVATRGPRYGGQESIR